MTSCNLVKVILLASRDPGFEPRQSGERVHALNDSATPGLQLRLRPVSYILCSTDIYGVSRVPGTVLGTRATAITKIQYLPLGEGDRHRQLDVTIAMMKARTRSSEATKEGLIT